MPSRNRPFNQRCSLHQCLGMTTSDLVTSRTGKAAKHVKKLCSSKSLIVVLEIYKLELCLWMLLALSSQPMTLEDIKPGGF